jgi:hypothetical protein
VLCWVLKALSLTFLLTPNCVQKKKGRKNSNLKREGHAHAFDFA